MTTSGRPRDALHARVPYGRLLLFAALLLGIVTMHTLGHPSGHDQDGGRGAAAVSYTADTAHAAGMAPGAGQQVEHLTSGAGNRAEHPTSGTGRQVEHLTSGAGHRAEHPTSGAGGQVEHLTSGTGHQVEHLTSGTGHQAERGASAAGDPAGPPASGAAAHRAGPMDGAETVAPGMPPMRGMDPLAVCLAVLGGFTLLLLLAVAWSGPWTDAVHPPVLARLLRTLRPEPPPPRTLLARLSVLRI
jgi:hypothetical protein